MAMSQSTPPALEEQLVTARGGGGAELDDLIRDGCELLRQREPRRAKELLERALALFPSDLNAQNVLALCYLQLGQLEDALIERIDAGAKFLKRVFHG